MLPLTVGIRDSAVCVGECVRTCASANPSPRSFFSCIAAAALRLVPRRVVLATEAEYCADSTESLDTRRSRCGPVVHSDAKVSFWGEHEFCY